MSMLMGLIDLSRSYWTLREAGYDLGAKLIARNILERQVKSVIARKSDVLATELIGADNEAHLDGLRRWATLEPNRTFVSQIAEGERSLDVFKALLSGDRYKKWKNIFNLFEEADLTSIYRSAYRELSGPAHGNFVSAITPVGSMNVYDFFAYVAPAESAMFVHHTVGCNDDACELQAEYEAIKAEARLLLSTPP